MKKVNQSDLTSTILTEDNLTLLTTDEVAEMLMVGKNRVYELLNKEELKGMRIGKSTWRIPKEAVLQFIREQSRLQICPLGISQGVFLTLYILR